MLKYFVLNCRVLMGGMVGPISDTFSHWYHQLMVSIFNQSRDRCSNPSKRFCLLQFPLECQHCQQFWQHFCHLFLQQLWGKQTWPDPLCLNSFLGRKLHSWNLHSIAKLFETTFYQKLLYWINVLINISVECVEIFRIFGVFF